MRTVLKQRLANFYPQFYRQIGRYWQQGLSLIVATLILMGCWQIGVGQALENWSYNTFFDWRGTLSWDQSLVVVEVDEASLQQLEVSPWSRQFYATLIDRLAAAEPAVIALTTPLPGISPDDQVLADAIRRYGRVVLAQSWNDNGEPIMTSPTLMQASNAIGHIQQIPDPDGITRSVPAKVAGISALGTATAQVYTAYTPSGLPIPLPDSQIWLNWQNLSQQIPHYSAAAAMSGEAAPTRFDNKIVLVGTTATNALPTPFDRTSYPVYFHAMVLRNILQQNFLLHVSWKDIVGLLLLSNIFLLSITTKWQWLPQLLLWLGSGLTWIGLSWIAFNANIWLPIATPALWFGLTGLTLILSNFLVTFQSLRRNETRYALMMQGFNEGLWDWDLKTNRFYFSPRWRQMVGYGEKDLSDRPQEWFERVHPLDLPGLNAAILEYIQSRYQGTHFEQEYRLLHQDGTYHWMQSRGLAVYDAVGKAERLVGSQIDITAQKQAEEELWRSTLFDRLTDLPSWTGFLNHLQQALNQVQHDPQLQFAILWLDLDQFKLVNNSLGNTLGDQLLIAIAQRLKSFLATNKVVARLGDDEFAILLQPIHAIQEAVWTAEQIQQFLACPFILDDHEVFVTASVGIALSAPHYTNPEHLLRDAGTAMHRAKSMGRASCLVFDKSMRTGMLVKLRLESDLRRAIAAGEQQSQMLFAAEPSQIAPILNTSVALASPKPEASPIVTKPDSTVDRYPGLELYYQPIVRLATRQVTGFEALVRWQHAEQGLLFPSRFISMAEETGLIIPLSWWVLRTACRQMSQWRSLFPGNAGLTMSVNLSSKQFSMPGLTEKIQRILQEVDLEPTYLKLELTESMVMENVSRVVDVLYELRALGIHLAIDDFGTGYSSLSYLPRFPLTTLKIDRSFVDRIGTCNDNREIVRAILSLARNLRMDVVAEGIETEAQAIRLREMGCEYGQGFFFYKPMDVKAATKLLADQ